MSKYLFNRFPAGGFVHGLSQLPPGYFHFLSNMIALASFPPAPTTLLLRIKPLPGAPPLAMLVQSVDEAQAACRAHLHRYGADPREPIAATITELTGTVVAKLTLQSQLRGADGFIELPLLVFYDARRECLRVCSADYAVNCALELPVGGFGRQAIRVPRRGLTHTGQPTGHYRGVVRPRPEGGFNFRLCPLNDDLTEPLQQTRIAFITTRTDIAEKDILTD